MPSNIVVNKMSTQHKASIGMASAFPDVCKTPAPPAPAPVPIPYPNIAMSAMASLKTSKKVKDNKQKVMVKGSAYSMSNGDQPGVAMGVVSNKIMGKSYIKNQSFNVKFEKKGVGRLADPHGNNCGSDPPNTVVAAQGQPQMIGMAGTDAEALKKRPVSGLANQQFPRTEKRPAKIAACSLNTPRGSESARIRSECHLPLHQYGSIQTHNKICRQRVAMLKEKAFPEKNYWGPDGRASEKDQSLALMAWWVLPTKVRQRQTPDLA